MLKLSEKLKSLARGTALAGSVAFAGLSLWAAPVLAQHGGGGFHGGGGGRR